jgi:N utilization substance protein B
MCAGAMIAEKLWPGNAGLSTTIPHPSTLSCAQHGIKRQLYPIFAPQISSYRMISRRLIRVKVMQTLYSIESMETNVKPGEDNRILQKHFDRSRQLLVYLLHFLVETARYVEKDARNRASKNLPTAEDLNINTKIAGNEWLWKILEDASLRKAFATDKPELTDSADLIKKTYQELCESPEYQAYVAKEGRDKKEERDIINFIFTNLMLPNESFIQHLEDHFTNWDDDAEMMNQLILNYLQKPGTYDFEQLLGEEKWKFAKDLLRTAQEKKEACLELIKPRLKNWDPERLAQLDMILMRLGVCEFLYFETIPTKVTINEYIDLAKEYSTPQSGQFVNGILDNIHKDLQTAGKLHKVSFRKD